MRIAGWWSMVALLCAAIATAAWLAISSPSDEDARGGSEGRVTIESLSNDRGRYLGQKVTLTGRILDVIDEKLLIVGRERERSKRVVVRLKEPARAKPAREPPDDGDLVKVTGHVEAVDVDELRDDSGSLGVEDGRSLEGFALIRAGSVTVTARLPRPQDAAHARPSEILANPDEYMGELRTVQGRADRIYGPSAFTIDGLLVISQLRPVAAVGTGDFVKVTGLPRVYGRQTLEQTLGLELGSRLSHFPRRPVLVARTVESES